MPLQLGTRLGNYEVVSELGSGGMGEVYKARDLKLGRDVAIKVLPQEMAADSSRLRRFEQEARAASALNHPKKGTLWLKRTPALTLGSTATGRPVLIRRFQLNSLFPSSDLNFHVQRSRCHGLQTRAPPQSRAPPRTPAHACTLPHTCHIATKFLDRRRRNSCWIEYRPLWPEGVVRQNPSAFEIRDLRALLAAVTGGLT